MNIFKRKLVNLEFISSFFNLESYFLKAIRKAYFTCFIKYAMFECRPTHTSSLIIMLFVKNNLNKFNMTYFQGLTFSFLFIKFHEVTNLTGFRILSGTVVLQNIVSMLYKFFSNDTECN